MKLPTLTIRNVPAETHAFYRQEAARNGHSMEEEVRSLLDQHRRQHQRKAGDVAREISALFAEVDGADDLADQLEQQTRQTPRDPVPFDG